MRSADIPNQQASPGTQYCYPATITKRPVSPSAEKSVADAMLTLSAQRPEDLDSAYKQQQQQQQVLPVMVKTEIQDTPTPNTPDMNRHQRKHREFIPESHKDESYWSKRRKNNEAAKRSREKRRLNDMAMGQRIAELTRENSKLKQELATIKTSIGWPLDKIFVGQAEMKKETPHVPIQVASATQQALQVAPLQEMPEQHSCPPVPLQVQFNNLPMLMPSQQSVFSPPAFLSPIHQQHQQYQQLQQHTGGSSPKPSAIAAYTNSQLPQVPPTDQPVGTGVYSVEPISPPPSRGCVTPDSRSDSPHSLKISLSGESSDSESEQEGHRAKSGGHTAAPLNLSTRQTDEGYSTNDSSSTSDMGADDAKRMTSAIPHKLRHKISSSEAFSHASRAPYPTSFPPVAATGLNCNRVPTQEESFSNHFPQSQQREPQDPKLDPRYLERRRRNNLAARKCRENRKWMSDLRMAKTGALENENQQLKDEISSLSSEISNLRTLLNKKKEAQAKGEPFTPPPLEEFTELRD